MTITEEKRRHFPFLDYKWTIIAIFLLGAVVNYLDRANLSIANSVVSHEFGLSPVQMGLLLSAFLWPYALANLPAGWLVDRFGINKVFLTACIIWSLATIAGGFAQGFVSLYVVRVILGIASSILNMGPNIANALAPPVLTILMVHLSWRGMYMTPGILGVFIVILWIVFYQKKDEQMIQKVKRTSESLKKVKVKFFKLFFHPSVFWFVIGNIGTSYMFWVYFTWLPAYLTNERHIPLVMAGWLNALPFAAGLIAVPLGGLISDYLVRKGLKVVWARTWPVIIGNVIAAICAFFIVYIPNDFIAIGLVSLSFFGLSIKLGVMWALVCDLSPSEVMGTFGGIQTFANFVGAALAPIGTGLLIEMTGDFHYVFIVSAVLCLIGAGAYCLIHKHIKLNEVTI